MAVVDNCACPNQRWTKLSGMCACTAATPKPCRSPLGLACVPLIPAICITVLTCRHAVTGLHDQSRRARPRSRRAVGVSRVESWSEAAVFGKRWEVSVGLDQFWHEDDYWQASFLWGGGFRVFFHPAHELHSHPVASVRLSARLSASCQCGGW